MKKILAVILAVTMLGLLAACFGKDKKKSSSSSAVTSQSAYKDIDIDEFEKKFLVCDYYDYNDGSNDKIDIRICLSLLEAEGKVKKDKEGFLPKEIYSEELNRILFDCFGINSDIKSYFSHDVKEEKNGITYLLDYRNYKQEQNYYYVFKKAVKNSIKDILLYYNTFDKVDNVMLFETVFYVEQKDSNLIIKKIIINKSIKYYTEHTIINFPDNININEFQFYKSVNGKSYFLSFKQEPLSILVIDEKTSKKENLNIISLTSNENIMDIKITGDKNIIITNQRVIMLNRDFTLLDTIDFIFSKNSNYELYDITSDLQTICYRGEDGVYISDINLKNPKLMAKDPKPYIEGSGMDIIETVAYRYGGFICNDTKVYFKILGYEWSEGVTVFDLNTNISKTIDFYSDYGSYETVKDDILYLFNVKYNNKENLSIYIDFNTIKSTEIQYKGINPADVIKYKDKILFVVNDEFTKRRIDIYEFNINNNQIKKTLLFLGQKRVRGFMSDEKIMISSLYENTIDIIKTS